MKLLVLTQLVLGLQAAQLVPGTADDWLTTCGSGHDTRKPLVVLLQAGVTMVHIRWRSTAVV
jgi:hypothetical protein